MQAPLHIAAASFSSPRVQNLLAVWASETGLTPTGGSTVAASDFTEPDGSFFVLLAGGEPVGCGGLRRLDDGIGEVKRLFVRRLARGRGGGHALMDAIELRATQLGMTCLRLDTDGREPAAVSLFQARGYRRIADYNGNPRARYWFEKAHLTPTASTARAPQPRDR